MTLGSIPQNRSERRQDLNFCSSRGHWDLHGDQATPPVDHACHDCPRPVRDHAWPQALAGDSGREAGRDADGRDGGQACGWTFVPEGNPARRSGLTLRHGKRRRQHLHPLPSSAERYSSDQGPPGICGVSRPRSTTTTFPACQKCQLSGDLPENWEQQENKLCNLNLLCSAPSKFEYSIIPNLTVCGKKKEPLHLMVRTVQAARRLCCLSVNWWLFWIQFFLTFDDFHLSARFAVSSVCLDATSMMGQWRKQHAAVPAEHNPVLH